MGRWGRSLGRAGNTARVRGGRLVSGAALVVLAGALVAAPAVRAADGDHSHGDPDVPSARGRIGVLLADHGEPPEYNQWTYESFREFFGHLIAMGIIPSWLTVLETGTILYDADCPACAERSESPRLIDAWLRPHDGPAAFVPASDSLPAHYVLPGGPGLGEPDIYEHVGLAAWHEWQRMGGRSPNYDEKGAKKHAVIERLRATYGDEISVRVGYGIDPRIGGGRQGIREALDALVNRDRIDSLVVVYHGVGFSDIMQTHHLRHQVAEHLESLGRSDMAVRYAAPLGTDDDYVAAIVNKVRAELALLPPDAPVAIHLSGHGLSTTMCGDYDCGADAYHRTAAELFARVRPAIEAAVDRPGRTGVFQIYGDGGEGDADPDDKVSSPIEALDARAAEGWTHVVDIPYEFDSNSRDTLIVLRQGYRRPQPDWNARWESRFAYKGMRVKIANANGGEAQKTNALYDVTTAALDRLLPAAAGAPSEVHGAADHRSGEAPSMGGGSLHVPPSVELSSVAHATPRITRVAAGDEPHSGMARFDRVGDRLAHREEAAAHGFDGGGVNGAAGLLLALAGGAALSAGALARRRGSAARVVVAALGIQLAGLAWDVIAHAQAGEPLDLLENAGHWLALAGLVAAAGAAIVLLRSPPRPDHGPGATGLAEA